MRARESTFTASGFGPIQNVGPDGRTHRGIAARDEYLATGPIDMQREHVRAVVVASKIVDGLLVQAGSEIKVGDEQLLGVVDRTGDNVAVRADDGGPAGEGEVVEKGVVVGTRPKDRAHLVAQNADRIEDVRLAHEGEATAGDESPARPG